MKKIICLCLASIILAISVFAVSASAHLGSGYTTVANDVTLIKTGLTGQKLCFSDADFKSAFAITDFDKITVNSIPSSTAGTLLVAGRRVKEGQSIKRKNVSAMVFVPASSDVSEAEFTFTIENSGSKTPSVCKMRFIDKINYAPKTPEDNTSSLSLTTQAQISVFGRLNGEDPEGDKLEYMIVAYPKNGTVTFTDKELGTYKYTPVASFTGYDSFTYVVRDEYGNYSKPEEVNIHIIERMSSEVYRDMTDRSEYNAAVAMSAMGIMSGKLLGDDKYFMPDETVSRAEFVAMAMKAYGMKADTSLTRTFFEDNGDIPTSLIPYVATAQKVGVVSGDFTEKGLVFSPNRAITKNEAAEIISAIMGLKGNDEETEYTENASVSLSARPSVAMMFTLGIFDGDIESLDGKATVTRAEAAEYLYRMIKSV